MSPVDSLDRVSTSVRDAIAWASVAARLWAPGDSTVVEPADLLVGSLLTHPDRDGEVWVLLNHFGLTVRDVLPSNYPVVNLDDLAVRAAEYEPDAVELSTATRALLDNGDQDVQVIDVLGNILASTGPLAVSLEAALRSRGVGLTPLVGSYRQFLHTEPTRQRETAGSLLRIWLRERMPRVPVDVPRYRSDGIDEDSDLVGIQTEADAFAYLIAARDLAPPLAVGLFGDWGSGKSFLMRAIRRRVHDLADKAHEHPDRAPVWQDIRQVEFNAWEYVQGNVWAGLLERIFATLGTLPERTSVVDAVRAPVTVALEAAQRSVSDAETERAQSTDAVAAKREEVLDAEARVRERRFDALERWAAQDGTAAAARDVLATYWQEHRAALLGKDGAELVEALGEVGGELRGGRALLGPYWRQPWRVVAVTAGLVLACVVAGLLAVAPLPPGVSFFGGLAALVPVVTTTLRSAASWSAKVRLAVEEARGKLREGLARSVEREERRAAAARAELADALAERDAADARLRAANEHHAALARRLGELTPARVLVEFADKRGEDYRRLLGPLATIREDIRAVEQQILNHNRDGTGVPNRIVLYIDDLDRCPPRTVVEVLEAIHLLLSFQIFVVVAAVDQRWLTAALLDQLPSLGPGRGRSVEHAGPAEYLEKIFQLPFLVRSLPDGARGQMLRGLLAPSVRDTQVGTANGHSHGLRVGVTERDAVDVMLARRGAGVRLETSALTLTSGDLKTIESFAPLIGDTPRRVKRFVNVCQLLLAMPPRLGDQRTLPGDREVVCFLAAVSEGLPTVAAALFAALQSTEVSAAKLIDWKPWGGVDPDEWNTLKAWVRAQPPSWSGTTLTRLSAVAPRIDMIHRMRFTELPEISTG